MAFSQGCVNAAAPVVYLLNDFVQGQGSLNAYPEAVKKAFHAAFDANIKLFERKTSQTPPGKHGPPLFEAKRVRNLAAVPVVLGSGDIVLGMALFPPYRVNKDYASGEWTDLEAPEEDPKQSKVSQALNGMEKRFWDAILKSWKEKFKDPPPTAKKPPTIVAEAGQAYSYCDTSTVRLKKGGQKKIYYAARLGIIDAAFPAGAAVWAWGAGKTRSVKLDILQKAGFSPQGVAEAAKKDTAEGREYLRRVGRGLAYNLLHEMHHAALREAGHAVAEGNITIESGTGANPKLALQFLPATITKILKEYQATWCQFRTTGVASIQEAK